MAFYVVDGIVYFSLEEARDAAACNSVSLAY